MTQLEPDPVDGLMAFDPADPHDPGDGDLDEVELPQSMAGLDGTQLAICPTCGTGVAADRLRVPDRR